MYYSVLPIDESTNYDISYEEIIYKDQLILTKNIDGIRVVERIYSSNPLDFLDPHLQPGAILQNSLINPCER